MRGSNLYGPAVAIDGQDLVYTIEDKEREIPKTTTHTKLAEFRRPCLLSALIEELIYNAVVNPTSRVTICE